LESATAQFSWSGRHPNQTQNNNDSSLIKSKFEKSKFEDDHFYCSFSKLRLQNKSTEGEKGDMARGVVGVALLLLGCACATPTDDLFEAVRNDDKKRIAAALHHGANINAKVCAI
jgi:hypothetical protein